VWRRAPPPAAASEGARHHTDESPIALFPSLTLTWNGATATLRNTGTSTLRAGEYGQPGYRAVLKFFDGQKQTADRWVALPRDLHPGEQVDIDTQSAQRITLTHALEGIPLVDETPAAEVEFPRVR
jgi:hypothetical protein